MNPTVLIAHLELKNHNPGSGITRIRHLDLLVPLIDRLTPRIILAEFLVQVFDLYGLHVDPRTGDVTRDPNDKVIET